MNFQDNLQHAGPLPAVQAFTDEYFAEVQALYANGAFGAAWRALQLRAGEGRDNVHWWMHALRLGAALGDSDRALAAADALQALQPDAGVWLPALRAAWAQAKAGKHWDLAKTLGYRLTRLTPEDVPLRVLHLLDALEAGRSRQEELKALMASPLPLGSFSPELLRRLIAALKKGGFQGDAVKMLVYLLQRHPPRTAEEKEKTALLACTVKCHAQAAALLEGEPGLASRYLCSLACHLALDWAGFEKARLSSAELLQLLETQPQWQPSMVFNFLMLPGYGHADYLALTRRLAHAMPSPKRYQYARPSARPDRLRVGYLSGDFKSHPCNQLACPVFERHDHKRFEWVAFDNSRDDASPARQRILAVFDRVVAVQGLGSVALAQAIRAEGIDVLVDMSGHTTDNRLDVMALRPAPVQITWLGFPASVGPALVDYMITDAVSVPPDDRAAFDEALMYLPVADRPGGECPPGLTPPPRQDQGLPDDAVVMACFNQVAKLTQEIFDLWCELLRTVPKSVLWLCDEGPQARQALQAAAALRGVQPDRLVWAARLGHQEHLRRLACADLILDTQPYTMHTTAVDALAAGVPFLTCCGNTMAGRVSSSLLHTAGLGDCVCVDAANYRQRMAALAADAQARGQLRLRFEAARTQSPLFDSTAFARYLEMGYDMAYARWQAGLPPADIAVGAG